MADTALPSFRQYGISITLSLAVGALCIVVFFAGFRSGVRLLPDFSNGYVEPVFTRLFLQMFILLLGGCGFFHMFGTQWIMGFQLLASSLFGFYSVWILDSEHILIYSAISLFNYFCINGLPIFNYSSLMNVSPLDCTLYFFGSTTVGEARCLGFLGFLQFLGLVAYIGQGIAICLAFRLWRISEFKQPSSYESINDAKIKSSITSYNSNLSAVSQPVVQQQKSSLVIREEEEILESQDINYDY